MQLPRRANFITPDRCPSDHRLIDHVQRLLSYRHSISCQSYPYVRVARKAAFLMKGPLGRTAHPASVGRRNSLVAGGGISERKNSCHACGSFRRPAQSGHTSPQKLHSRRRGVRLFAGTRRGTKSKAGAADEIDVPS
jgi:hypothetical protein